MLTTNARLTLSLSGIMSMSFPLYPSSLSIHKRESSIDKEIDHHQIEEPVAAVPTTRASEYFILLVIF